MEACLQKETIIEVFEREKLHVEINENKNGNVVVSRMCELYKHQVFADDRPWDDNVEMAIKDKVNLSVKSDLRKLIVQEQRIGKPIKPILSLAGPLPKRNSFTFDLAFMFRLEQSNNQVLEDTVKLIYKIEEYLASIKPE